MLSYDFDDYLSVCQRLRPNHYQKKEENVIV